MANNEAARHVWMVLSVLGPKRPSCIKCQGCVIEWDMALAHARIALGLLEPDAILPGEEDGVDWDHVNEMAMREERLL